jgi:hypoxanthine phosphoribosyltransferase
MLIRTPQEDIETVLFSKEDITRRVEELAQDLQNRLEGDRPIMVCVLKGAVFFFADLCRCMTCPADLDFLQVSSYGMNAASSGEIILKKDLEWDITDRTVVLVEDIVDSGLTLRYLEALLSKRGAKRVLTVAFLDRGTPATDLCGYSIGNEFVVGYGLDYAEHYRNLPYIGTLNPQCYND